MFMAVFFSQIKSSLTFGCFTVDTYLFRQEVEEYIDMTTHCSMMDVSKILSILLVAISTKLDESLDTIVGTILDR